MARRTWLIEFESGEAALAAARRLREQGHARLELYSPYELEGADEALALERPRVLPRAVLIAGLSGAATAYAIQWYVDAVSYPIDVGGRPLHSAPAFVPITFEGGVLIAAFAAFFGLLRLARLPRLWQPVFEVAGFERASIDRFWLALTPARAGAGAGTDRDVEEETEVARIRADLAALAPLRIECVEGEP
ncbi:MAG: DUF3341 domain-containing protein [Myxococcota bacterium]